MSSKSKLTLALLAATALFTFNPGLVPRLFSMNERVSAEEILLDKSSINGLDALTGTMDETGSKLEGVNAALVPGAQQTADVLSAVTEGAVQRNVAPGENPFAASAVAVTAVTPSDVTPTSEAFALENAAQNPVAVAPAANPFVDPAVLAKQVEAAQPAAAKAAKVDDGALRYYASSKDLKRLGAEMRRLKSLYPDWQPPKDLFSPATNVSEQPLWDIYKSGDYAKVRSQIALMQSTNPKWVPSDDLLLKLQHGEARTLISRAYNQSRWQQVISAAQASPSILVCGEMQVLWNVGESFAQMRNYAQSFDLYKYILTNCADPKERLATVQKASLVLPSQGVTSLLAFGKTMPDGSAEFENIGFDGVRRQLGAFIQEGDFASTPSDEELKRFVDFVQRTGSGADAALIGWYFYAQEEWKTANSWFIQAAQYERSPKNIEGVVLTLRNMERPEDALKVARRYMKASPEITDQYVEIIASSMTAEQPEITLKDKEVADFEKVVADRKSALGAQAIGWKYLAADDKAKAQEWFTDSVSWKPTEGGVVGLAVMASRAKNYKVLSALKAKYAKEYASLDDFKIYNTAKSYKWKKKKVVTSQVEKPKKKRRLYLFQSDDT